jgi:hypothetical protein
MLDFNFCQSTAASDRRLSFFRDSPVKATLSSSHGFGELEIKRPKMVTVAQGRFRIHVRISQRVGRALKRVARNQIRDSSLA